MEKSANLFAYRRKLRLALLLVAAAIFAGLLGMTIWSRFASSARGVHEGKLADCPPTPNCVCSEASRPDQQIPRLPWYRDAKSTIELVREVLAEMPRTKISQHSDDRYFHVECTSALFRFVDDLEIYLDSTAQEIQIRSASRIGHSDLGANRRRVEEFQRRYRQLALLDH